MRAAAPLGYAAGLALAFGLAFLAGSTFGPTPAPATGPGHSEAAGHPMPTAAADAAHSGHSAETDPARTDGLTVSQAGYTLVPAETTLPAGRGVPFRFTVTGPDGTPVRDYTPSHTKDLHLIAVRRDLSSFEHLHPTRAADGTWSGLLSTEEPGLYRLFADFVPAGGPPLTLGTDVAVAGVFAPAAVPQPSRRSLVDGYEVTLDGDARAGTATTLTATVRHDGRPVTDLEPYLGAFGHLVSLRSGDLAYLHNHPAQDAAPGTTGGPGIAFGTSFPSAGTYRLFLDFQVGGTVRTATFTIAVPAR